LWVAFHASYFALLIYYFLARRAPMPIPVAAVLSILTLVISANQWCRVGRADEEQVRKAFDEEEKWPGG
jgi:hypothetical protein